MLRLLSLVLLATSLTAGAAHAQAPTVRAVVDGDTLRVRTAGRIVTVDLVGVRAPAAGTCFATQSRTILRRLLPVGTRVRLLDDPVVGGRGRYVIKAGVLVNAAVIRAGAARTGSTRGLRRASALLAAQAAARDAGRGLFGRCTTATPPQPQPPAAGDEPQSPPPGSDPVTQRAQMKAALDGRVLSDFRTDSNSSTRNDTIFCADGRVQRREEFIPRGSSSILSTFAGSWAVLQTARNADGSLSAAVVVRADDPSFDNRILRLVLGSDGRVRNTDFSATDNQPAPRGCDPLTAFPDTENDTPAARDGLAAALQGVRLDAAGRQTDFCPARRLVRREGGNVVADATLTVEWALRQGSARGGTIQVVDQRRGTSRRMFVEVDGAGAVRVQELGLGNEDAAVATRSGAVCA